MVKHLVIVESPAKVKTIKKFLGTNYDVAASGGHVRDLPKSSLGIDVEHDYEPKYITIRGKGEVLADLRKRVKKADKIYLATDPDREGEAIAWHLYFALKLQDKKVYRISFNEITKNAVKEALKSPREIDMDLVDSQQVRRVLDRLVGYTISPLLWAKVKRGLSAGRVQSVALRLLCDREEAIHAFTAEEYWSLEADLRCEGERKAIPFKYYGEEGKKAEIHNQEEMEKILADLEGRSFRVAEIRKGERSRKAPLPFTTSTLQQEASKVLNFSTGKTMRIAQQLYEGVEVKGNGTVGIITYLRTDSTRVSEYAAQMVKDYIVEKHGEAYVGNVSSGDKNKKNVQDAHEAIRPTNVAWTPAFLKDSLSRDQFRLYQLIWKRFVASAMKNARFDTLSVKAEAGRHRFTAAASVMSFDGFLTVYDDGEEEKTKIRLDKIKEDSLLIWEAYRPEQHFTQPEPHFTEASLVRTLEERGIGRPSTYAPTIMTLLARRYVVKEEKNLYVTELGEVVNQMMKQSFPSIVDVDFTVNMETLLDSVEEGEISWKTIVRNFYPDLDEAVKRAEEDLAKVQIADELSDEFCEHCGRQMVIKYGPYGKFLACPGFPECKNTKPYLEKIGIKCPKCGGEILLKRTKKGRRYYGCEHNPECDYMMWRKPEADEKGVAKAVENL